MRQIQDMERRLYVAFTQMDEDGNGLISAQELKRIACSKVVKTMLSDIGMHYRDIFDAVETIDDDNDGHVDYEEFVAFVFHQEEAASKLDCRKLKYQISELHDELLDLKINMGMPLAGDAPSNPVTPKTPTSKALSPRSNRNAALSARRVSQTGSMSGAKVANILPMPDFKFKKDEDGKPLRSADKIRQWSNVSSAIRMMSIATASSASGDKGPSDDSSSHEPAEGGGGNGGVASRGPHKIVPSRLKPIDTK